jgi:hypothetical protein
MNIFFKTLNLKFYGFYHIYFKNYGLFCKLELNKNYDHLFVLK